MRPGEVVSLRLNPLDCMAIVDMLKIGGVDTEGISFSQAVATVVQSMLESARIQAVIPVRDGFDYMEVMRPFSRKKKGPAKGGIIAAMGQIKAGMHTAQAAGMRIATASVDDVLPPVDMTPLQRRSGLRMKEMLFKQEHAPDTWTAEDQGEFDTLYKIVYPDG